MDIINVLFTSVSMSVDASTVGAVDGVTEAGMNKRKMCFIAFLFGLFQFVMPVIGYFIGYLFKDQLEPIIPWIAFSLLSLLSLRSLLEWFKEIRKKDEAIDVKKIGLGTIMLQSVATSIDALCIGFVFLNYSISDAMIAFSCIGITTFLLSFLAILFGNKVANKLEKWGGLIAGIVFLAIGLKILLEGIL